jgi:hypothetical protein
VDKQEMIEWMLNENLIDEVEARHMAELGVEEVERRVNTLGVYCPMTIATPILRIDTDYRKLREALPSGYGRTLINAAMGEYPIHFGMEAKEFLHALIDAGFVTGLHLQIFADPHTIREIPVEKNAGCDRCGTNDRDGEDRLCEACRDEQILADALTDGDVETLRMIPLEDMVGHLRALAVEEATDRHGDAPYDPSTAFSFRDTFKAVHQTCGYHGPCSQFDGKPFALVEVIDKPTAKVDAESLPMFRIRCEDCLFEAWPEEVLIDTQENNDALCEVWATNNGCLEGDGDESDC